MSETVTVIEAKNPNPWEHGITYYDMVFDRAGQRFGCAWGTKGGEPQPGEEVVGEFSQKPDGSWKFTKGSKDKPPPSGGSSEASISQSDRGDVGARIERQAVLKALSPRLATEGLNGTKAPTVAEEVEAVENFIDQAGQRASEGQRKEATPSPLSSEPESPRSLDLPQTDVPDAGASLEEIGKALDNAGVIVPAARAEITAYMVGQLPPERIVKAVNGLTSQDLELQARVKESLIKATEEHQKRSLAQGDALDGMEDPPF